MQMRRARARHGGSNSSSSSIGRLAWHLAGSAASLLALIPQRERKSRGCCCCYCLWRGAPGMFTPFVFPSVTGCWMLLLEGQRWMYAVCFCYMVLGWTNCRGTLEFEIKLKQKVRRYWWDLYWVWKRKIWTWLAEFIIRVHIMWLWPFLYLRLKNVAV